MILSSLILILLCLLGTAFFAGIETGVISLNRLRLRHLVRHKARGADVLEYFLHDPDHLLGTTLVGTNLCQIAASVLAADLGAHFGGAAGTAVVTALMALAVLVFCEYLPKAWFQSSPTLRSLPFARLLKWSGLALLPLSSLLGLIMGVLIPRRGGEQHKTQPLVSREELLHLAREGEQTGILSREELAMIHSIFQLRDRTCGEILIPRKDVVYVRTDTSADEIVALARAKEFTRFPVYDEAKKAFVGIVHVFDVLSDREPAGKTAAAYMRPPQFVSIDTPADHVLPRMRVTRQPLVMVLDERYDMVGMVTIENVLVQDRWT